MKEFAKEDFKEPVELYCHTDLVMNLDSRKEALKGKKYQFTYDGGTMVQFINNSMEKHYYPINELHEHFMIEHKDLINSPEHYKQGGIETIDFVQAKLTPEEFKGYLKGNAIKYLSRATMKGNEADDYAKSQWYINRLNSK